MLKHLLNHWQIHGQKPPFVLTDGSFGGADLSTKNKCSVNQLSSVYQGFDSRICSSVKSEYKNGQLEPGFEDVYKPERCVCGTNSLISSCHINRPLAHIHTAPPILQRETSFVSEKKTPPDGDPLDVSLDKSVMNDTEITDNVTNSSFSNQIKTAYEQLKIKRAKNSNASEILDRVSTETEDSGVQMISSCASSLENVESTMSYCPPSKERRKVHLVEPIISVNQDQTSPSREICKGHENIECYLHPSLETVRENRVVLPNSITPNDQPNVINEDVKCEMKAEALTDMLSVNIIKHPLENVSGLNGNLKTETVLRSDDKSLNDSHQTLAGVTHEILTSKCKQMSCFKSEMNRIMDTDFHPRCNSELPQQSQFLFTPNSSLPKPPMVYTECREKINIATDSKNLPKLANQLQLKERSTLSQKRNHNRQTSQRRISILKTSNNSILSERVLECSACKQSSIRQKLSNRELVSGDVNISKSEPVSQNDVSFGDGSSCRLDNVDIKNSMQEGWKSVSSRIPQYVRNKSSLCKKCEIHKTDKESKQYEDYYSSLREAKSRKRPADFNGCPYCEKQTNRDSSVKSKIKSRSWNARKLDTCRIFLNESTMANSVDSKCKDIEHHSHGSLSEFIREMEDDVVFDIHSASGANQQRVMYQYPYATLRCSKERQKPDIHLGRCVCGNQKSIESRNQWSDSHCTCSYHTDPNDGHQCHAKSDKRKRRNTNKVSPRLEDKGVGTELQPSVRRMDYLCRNEDEKTIPSIEDVLAYERFQNNTRIHHLSSPFQASQIQDFYRSYPCLDVGNVRDFLHRKHLQKRRKRALFMGVMAICIVLVVGIIVAVVFTSIRHKHYNFP